MFGGPRDTGRGGRGPRETRPPGVVTLTVDVGGGSLRDGVAERAIASGASKAYVVDARSMFVEEYVWPSLQAGALYQDVYPLATALARPLIARLLVEVARRESAGAVAHGCTGKGNDQVRFDVSVKTLAPDLTVIAPLRQGMDMTRDEEIEYAQARGIPVPVTKASPYSVDVNLWGRSVETGVLEDPWVAPPADAYSWTVAPSDAPAPVEITIRFLCGVPTTLDGEQLGAVELVERLNSLAGAHGVGRIDHVEDRLVGIKSREVYEAPAAVVLHACHRALEGLTLSKEQLRFGRLIRNEVAQAAYDGLWCSALQRDLRDYVRTAQRNVTGEVRMRLDHGTAAVVGRRSPQSLYDKSLATYDTGDLFDHASAVGFIALWGLPLRTEAARDHRSAGMVEPDLLDQLEVVVTEGSSAASRAGDSRSRGRRLTLAG